MTKAPFGWSQRIQQEIAFLSQEQLFGKCAAFDFEEFSKKIAARLGLFHLQIIQQDLQTLEDENLYQGFGKEPIITSIETTPIGTVYWLMSHEDVNKLTSWMLNTNAKSNPLSSEILQEGFYRYLQCETLDVLQSLQPIGNFTLQLNDTNSLKQEKSFCIDFEIVSNEKSCWARLVVPLNFQKKWVQYFEKNPNESISKEIAQNTSVQISVKKGQIEIKKEDWDRIEIGDFLILDEKYQSHNLYTLNIGKLPLFQANVLENKIQILDYAKFIEQENPNQTIDNTQDTDDEKLKHETIHLNVEIANINMTLDDLMNLKPKSEMDLIIHPNQTIFLYQDSRKIADAELMYLADKLGVRIISKEEI